nr:capsid protein [Cyclovirus sp.]
MPRYRRVYNRFRRRPLYRRRALKPVRRYRRRFHRRRTPHLACKITRTLTIDVAANSDNIYAMNVTLDAFAEHRNLAPNFERVKVLRQNIRVFPQQNVANNSTSRVGTYAIVPYHKPIPASPISFATAVSIDRAKIYRCTEKGRMSFVPAARLSADATPNNLSIRTDWRPEFEIGTGATLPHLYTGFISVENLGADVTIGPKFVIIQDLYVIYKNQRSFI